MIDYVLVEEVSREEVVNLEIKDYVESDHQPLVVKLRGGERRKRNRKKGGIRNCRDVGMKREKWNLEDRLVERY